MAEKKRGLGAKGLGINALINTEVQDLKTAKSNETVTELDLDLIEPNRKQPRKYFDETALEELAASLKAYGMIQPIVVKKNGEYYEIIAGERRWRAAKIAGMEKVPVVLKEDDPNFASVFLTNLGSIQCPSVYHHLNNYGTNSIMIAIGTMHKAEKIAADGTRQVRDVVELGITLDERVADGFYFGRSLKIVQHLMSHPELLDRPLKEAIDLDC